MSSNCPLWISINKNTYNPNGGTPVISRGMNESVVRSPNSIRVLVNSDSTIVKQHSYYDQTTDEVTGLRGLSSALVKQIFLLAARESSYTRWQLPQVCRTWRELALGLSQLWSRLFISHHSTSYDRGVFNIQDSRLRYWNTSSHICLSSPSITQLYDLVGYTATNQWESLHIILEEPDVDITTVETIFTGASFNNLKYLRIEEKPNSLDFGLDPYAALYDAIFLTATKLQSLYVNSDLKAVAQQYGLFGQRITDLGGSAGFISSALPLTPDGDAYSHITRLSLYRWDFEVVKNLTLPGLQYLHVDHCSHEEANRTQASVILPSLLEIHLTAHSLPVLSSICAGGLEALVIEQNDFDKWYSNIDGCLPPSSFGGSSPYLCTFDLDVWSTPSLERVQIYPTVSVQHLLTFLHNAKGLKDLTLAVPNNQEWCDAFTGAMGARWGYSNHLGHCPQLETLTLLMDWDYTEGEWLEEIRRIFDTREDTVMKSIICRWTGDARNPESGPAGNFEMFGGEYYGGAGEPDIGGPNLPSESKQVEVHTPANKDMDEEEIESDSSDEMEDDEDDDEDMLDLYDDIPFP